MPPRSNVPIRIGGSKVRTGCRTCKQRHVKCDETRPVCLKCQRLDRQCIYDQPPAGIAERTAHDIQRTLSLAAQSRSRVGSPNLNAGISLYGAYDVAEVGAVKNFAAYLGRDLAGCFSNDLWCRVLPRMAQHEPPIWHGIAAVSALDTSIRLRYSCQNEPSSTTVAIKQYSKAIQALNERLGSGDTSNRKDVVLVSCILFAIFECLRDHSQSALKHIAGGMKLLTEWTHEAQSETHSSAGSYFDYASLRPAFLSLDSQAIQMGDKSFQEYTSLPAISSQLIVPTAFATVEEAHSVLIHIFNRITRWAEQAEYGIDCGTELDVVRIKQERQELEVQLLQWDAAFEKVLIFQPQPGTLLLLLQRKVMQIYFGKQADGRSELGWDNYIPLFEQSVAYAEAYMKLTAPEYQSSATGFHGQAGHSIKPGPLLTVGMDLVLPLYLISAKCRDSGIRRRALAMLKTCNRKEGIWDSHACAELAERLILSEERGALQNGFIPESARIYTLDIHSGEEGGGQITPQTLVLNEDSHTYVQIPQETMTWQELSDSRSPAEFLAF